MKLCMFTCFALAFVPALAGAVDSKTEAKLYLMECVTALKSDPKGSPPYSTCADSRLKLKTPAAVMGSRVVTNARGYLKVTIELTEGKRLMFTANKISGDGMPPEQPTLRITNGCTEFNDGWVRCTFGKVTCVWRANGSLQGC